MGPCTAKMFNRTLMMVIVKSKNCGRHCGEREGERERERERERDEEIFDIGAFTWKH